MDEERKIVGEVCQAPGIEIGLGGKLASIDLVTEKLRTDAIDSLNAYLIRLLEKKDFCQARRIGTALEKIL